jgi:hypothetical protein
MPIVQITMLAGRTVEQKRKIAQRVTDGRISRGSRHSPRRDHDCFSRGFQRKLCFGWRSNDGQRTKVAPRLGFGPTNL